MEAYEKRGLRSSSSSARKTARLVEELKAAEWQRSPRTDADGQCEFCYQPEGWGKAYRFLALRYEKKRQAEAGGRAGAIPIVRDVGVPLPGVCHEHGRTPLNVLVWFYNQRAGAENLIKEANNDAGLAAHPSGRWMMNCNRFQMAMLAYNLNCWLMLFNREEEAKVGNAAAHDAGDRAVAVLFLAAKIWRHAGRVGVSYSDHYEDQGLFHRLMDRLRAITTDGQRFGPVLATALTG